MVWDGVLTFDAGLILNWKPMSTPNLLLIFDQDSGLSGPLLSQGCRELGLRDALGVWRAPDTA